ncbi:uncharacterized protein LOC100166804 precursor [Acyrthosiphon pisum]|uniref:ACYPI007645 protein n=1 Tax=Acyrthosiphon pisum TaxID=7029 RepID=C4WXA1_ACYPI|nr:uncharacterized protein LOC100166804 precursor [Acyrthosiphon pisum]BAH72521.1 ACYPI007645 [Acyrthosiphon pisum]|eukprot:NP_001156580.1 uncharacterized protein LOC100166804 precursor [Acyrthosiphon pisum]
MAVLNIVVCTTLIVVTSLGTVQSNSIPTEIAENQWVVDAQNSIKDSLSKIESYGVENEKIKTITNEAFDTFTKFVENDLSKIIKKADDIKSERIWVLKTQLKNWSSALERLNEVSDVTEKTPDKAIGKFYMTIDYIAKEVVGFDQNYNYDSNESNEIVEELKLLLKKSVTKLVEYANSVEDQVSGISKIE